MKGEIVEDELSKNVECNIIIKYLNYEISSYKSNSRNWR